MVRLHVRRTGEVGDAHENVATIVTIYDGMNASAANPIAGG